MTIRDLYQLYCKTYTVSTDTRKLPKNCLFFALKGENFNANKFAKTALSDGASYVVIDDKDFYQKDPRYILVDNVLETLQELASFHRKKLGIPIIALTGSNGKTTTKELIDAVLLKKIKTTATLGNLNNHIGVPLTLLSMTPKTEMGIVEMGANHFEEIALLCDIASPDFGYITNFGKAHLEGFGSLEGVVKAKSELYQCLAKNDGIAFVNHHDIIQVQKTIEQKRQIIGDHITNVPSRDFVKVRFDDVYIESNLLGDYNYYNLMAAIGIGQYFKVPNDMIKAAIESYVPTNKRSQLLKIGNKEIILDAYNANPTSMRAALTSFISSYRKNKVLILGDMFELGESAAQEHQQVLDLAVELGFKNIKLIGEHFYQTTETIAEKYKNFKVFTKAFVKSDYDSTSILIKGSRGMALERILELLE